MVYQKVWLNLDNLFGMITVSDNKRYTNHRGLFYEFQLSSTRNSECNKVWDTREVPSWISIFPVKVRNTFTSPKVKHKEDFVSHGIEFEKPRICVCFTIHDFVVKSCLKSYPFYARILSIWTRHVICYYLMHFSLNKNFEHHLLILL